MCGLAGFFGSDPPSLERVENTIECIKHRGPDGKGTYARNNGNGSVVLIHRRLSILDLETRSDQPFRLNDCVLVFNGEVYNYIEVKKELEGLGHSFTTSGDTEVLAHVLQEWGIAGLDKLEGMWAFAWYNETTGELVLSRDRFGEKPLYLWRRKEGLYFSSEIKGLTALAGEKPSVNEEQLLRYLVNGYKSLYKKNETFYSDVEELPLACCLVLKGNTVATQHIYWKPWVEEKKEMTFRQAVESTREAMIEAVKLRMRSDVPLAFCMSGGIDSNSLISIAKKELDCDVHGFTIVNADARYEEKELVDHMVAQLGIRHTAVEPEQTHFIQNMRKLVAAHDAPVYTISYYVHWKLMEAMARQGYKVSISGTGADELFTGYYDHHNLYLYEVSKYPELHKEALANWKKYQAGIVRNPYLQNPDLYIENPGIRDHIYLNNDVFSSYLCKPWTEVFTETDFGYGLLRNRMLNELFVEGTRIILHEDDLNAMYFSMENRSPFLDRKLFETAYAVPVQYLVQNGIAKYVLREAMRGIVPDKILDNHRKVGFNAPILDLLDVKDPQTYQWLLDDSRIFGLVQKSRIEELLKQEEMSNSFSKFLFNFINAKLFLEEQAS